MKRRLVAAVLGLALTGCILLPLGSRDAIPDPRHRFVVSHVAGDLTVDANGDLTVRETLDVDVVGTLERAFYVSIDRNSLTDSGVRRDVTGLRVTRDGRSVPLLTRTTSAGRYVTLRIGALASSPLSEGHHSYVVDYRVARVLDAGTTSPTRFDWLVVPATFNEPVDAADISVHLPAAAATATCATQQGGSCAVAGQGTRDVTVHARDLPRLGSVRLDAGLPMSPPPGPARLPWSVRASRVLGTSVPGVLFVLVLTLLAAMVGLVLARGAFERRLPALPAAEPPDDVGPAAAAYVAHERLDHRAFVATLFWAAQKQIVRIDQLGNRWRVTGILADDDLHQGADVAVAMTAFLGGPRETFTARRGDAAAFPELQQRLRDMEDATRDWCVLHGLFRRTGPGRGWSAVLVGLAVFAAFFAALTQVAGASISALVPAGFALGAMPLLGAGAATRRTRRGRELAAQLAGLRGTFDSPLSAGVRASSYEDLYLAFLPWAVMTGCLDPWTRRFRESTGIEPPLPAYLPPSPNVANADVGATVLDFAQAFEARRRRDLHEST